MIKTKRCFIIISVTIFFFWESSMAQLTVLGSPYIRESGMWFELIGREKGNQIIPNEIMVVLNQNGKMTTNVLRDLEISGVERIEVKIPDKIFKLYINQEIDDLECFHIAEQLSQKGLFNKVFFSINTTGVIPVIIDDITYFRKNQNWFISLWNRNVNITRLIQVIVTNRLITSFPFWILKEISDVESIPISLYTTSSWRTAKRKSLNSDKTGYRLRLYDTLSDTECIEFVSMLYYAGLCLSIEFVSLDNILYFGTVIQGILS